MAAESISIELLSNCYQKRDGRTKRSEGRARDGGGKDEKTKKQKFYILDYSDNSTDTRVEFLVKVAFTLSPFDKRSNKICIPTKPVAPVTRFFIFKN